MESKACSFCGASEDLLLEIYPGDRIQDRRPFCGLCIDTGAGEAFFAAGADRLAAYQQLAGTLIRELRSTGRKATCITR